MTKPTDHQVAALGAAFDSFARRYKLAEALGSEKPLNELDRQTLLYVSDHPDCGPTDVARFLGVPNTTISSATDRLVKRGLLLRNRQEGDRRAVALHLSEEGSTRVASFLEAHHDISRRMLEPLSVVERDRLISMITKIVNHED